MDILRITKAEFIKIFKKPSVYIMAGFLLISIFLTTLFYSPVVSANSVVSINGATVGDIYTTYKGNSGIDIESEYLKNITEANKMLDFYGNNNDRIDSLDDYYNSLVLSYKAYESSLLNYNEDSSDVYLSIAKRDYDSFVISLNDFIDNYKSLEDDTDFIATAYISSTTYVADSSSLDDIQKNFSTNWHYNTGANDINTAHTRVTSDNTFDTLKDITNRSKTYVLSTLNDLAKVVQSKQNIFIKNSNIDSTREVCRTNLKNAIDEYYNYLTSLIENEYPIVLITSSDYQSMKDTITDYLSVVNYDGYVTLTISSNIAKQLQNKNYDTQIIALSKTITNVNVDNETLTNLKTTYTDKIATKIDSVSLNISELSQENAISTSTKDKDNILKEITKIKELCSRTKSLYSSTIYLNILDNQNDYSISSISNSKLNGINTYKLKENIVKYNYLTDKNEYQFDYGNVFNTGATYTSTKTGYDFMYFSLSLGTIFIILFAIAMITNLISYENDNGTIKLILIRPFQRYKIITGKLLATLFFAIIFEVFAFIVSLIYGAGMFGLTTVSILGVFNATSAYTTSPILLSLLFLLFSIGDIIFYTILATMISTISKTFAGSIASNYITYAIILLCNAVFGSLIWYSYLPFVATNLFKFFGVANVATSTNFLQLILCTPTTEIMNIYYSLTLNVSLIFIMLYTTYVIFKRRDY